MGEKTDGSRFSVCVYIGKGDFHTMSLIELFLIAVGLSMDAFAVSICKGLSVKKAELRHALTVGGYFGGFQGLMPALGFLLATTFAGLITKIAPWIAFVLLAIIGSNMIRESLKGCDDCEDMNDDFSFKAMLPLAVATSIDAMASGVTFALMQIGSMIVPAVLFIGCITFALSALGLKVGNVFGTKYKSRAELFGGVVLVVMGLKILLEHLGVIG